jgi:hypothetical protein
MTNFAQASYPLRLGVFGTSRSFLIQVAIRNTQHGQTNSDQPPFVQASTWLKIVNRVEKLTTTGDPLMPRFKGGIGQKNNFDLFGSLIM